MDPELQKYLKLLVKIAILVLSLVAVYLLFSYVFPILGKILACIPVLFLPFIIAVLLAVVIEPVVIVFENRLRFKRRGLYINCFFINIHDYKGFNQFIPLYSLIFRPGYNRIYEYNQ